MLCSALQEIATIATVKKKSRIWETEPWGETEQEPFLNAAVEVETEKNPHIFLEELQRIEKKLGRKQRKKWGPREIDIDIVFWGKEKIRTKNLVVPHRFWKERAFVVFPMADIAPDFVPLDTNKTIAEWKTRFPKTEVVVCGDFLE